VGLACLAGVAVLLALGLPGDAGACDDPVLLIAREQGWQRVPFTLLMAYQQGVGDPKAFEKEIGGDWLYGQPDQSPVAALNLAVAAVDMAGWVGWDYRWVLEEAGGARYPLIVLVDGEGKELIRFSDLAEARERLSPPSTQPEVVSYSMRKIELKTPPARAVIFYDEKVLAPAPTPEASQSDSGAAQGDPVQSPADAQLPSRALAEQWAQSISGQPLAGLNHAELVNLRAPGADAALVEALKLHPLPLWVLVDGFGQTLERFDRAPTVQDVKKISFSPVRDQIIKALEKPDATMLMLFIHGRDAQADQDARAVVDRAIEQSGKKVPIIEVDPADEREAYLLKQVDHRADQAAPTVVPVFGQGRILEPIVPEPGQPLPGEYVLMAIQFVDSPGCRDIPVGYSLLLGESGQEWAGPAGVAAPAGGGPGPIGSAAPSRWLAPRKWLWLGLAAVAALGAVGVLMLRAKFTSVRRRAGQSVQG